jgi:flagellin-specific chaperone FliS
MGNSERTGFILQNLKAQNINDILVYSIDYHLDLSLVSTLKSVYNITIPDTVLVNEKEKLEKIQNINDIEAVI